jgi:putative ABC transport system permease protein
VQGRSLTAADNNPNAPFVALVNQAFVRKYFPHENPIGRHIRPDMRELRNQSNDMDTALVKEREIVGVIADFQEDSITDPPEPFAVFPYAQASALMRPTVVLRVTGDPMHYQKSVEAVVAGMDPFLFLIGPHSMTMQLDKNFGAQRFEILLISAFASLALFLSSIGLYSTLSSMVTGRAREIGLRMAVGAKRRDVAVMVLSRAAILVVCGLFLGSVVALVAARVLESSDWWNSRLFGVSTFDPRTYGAVLLVLGAVSIAACLYPTWRAVSVEPMRVLRDE